MFRRRAHARAEWADIADVIGRHLTEARAETRAALRELHSAAAIDRGAEMMRRDAADEALTSALDRLRHDVASHEGELARALTRVADSWDLVRARLEVDRRERASLIDAVARLARSFGAPPSRGSHSVIGGSFAPALADELHRPPPPGTTTLERDDATSIDGGRESYREGRVEVYCHFDHQWIGGFEICESVAEPDGRKVRLRRRSDGFVLPQWFGDEDIRLGVSLADG